MKRFLILLAFFIPLTIVAQNITIAGNVSSDIESLPSVNIIEKGTTNGVVSDFNGNYTITVKQNATLVFSFLGYETKEIAIQGKKKINVILKEDTSFLNEIVVEGFAGVVGQARRRAESIQSIPESVVTMTATEIENAGITNLQSFSAQVPNVNFNTSQNVGVNFVTVRGIPQIRNGEAPISFVIDGVTVPDSNLLNQELFDLAMVEVVKGPQGALYGKNAIAGAINIVTKKPTNSFRNKVNIGYASGNTIKGQGAFSGPIVKDKVYYRVSGSYKKSDGLFYNITNETVPDYFDDYSARGQLYFNVTDDFKITLSGQYNNINGGGLYYHIPANGASTVDPNEIDDVVATSDVLGKAFLKNLFAFAKLEYDFENMKLQSVTSYNKAERNGSGDLDHSAAPILLQDQDSNSEVFNQEFRLSSKDTSSKISWDLGAFYQRNERYLRTLAQADFGFFAPPFAPTGTFSDLGVSDFTNTYNTIALFGFLDYKLSDKVTLSFGLRYDNDQIEQVNPALGSEDSKNDSEVQPKFSISYAPYKDVLLFANYGRGYRVGGFNAQKTTIFDREYQAETSDNYELGFKSSWWNNRFILNIAAFYTSLNNQQQYGLQLAPPNIILGNYNYNRSNIKGFEVDMKLRASKYLDIIASYGAVDASIKEAGSAGDTDRTPFNGVRTPFVPQDSFNISLQSNVPVSESVSLRGILNLKGTGEILWHEELPDLKSPRYNLLDLRFGASFNKNLDITLWGANILDEKYAQEFYSSQSIGGPGQDLIWLGNPATYGVELSYKF
ncbi:iron complex outermembrane recepter protein [Tenacibaculum sp. MAR_2009_124]|uniref:TonB-dependent receptor n=1 Tax=Tenacibaculum sp. MAR_2009_124 TaxID=1250059 RepID=UPI00089708DB|nr:TonB-dependent receptor [Tenacibaculum sp. MAR_2009_124]SEC00647.1 iron complex outermembrane recepter protein [Tenacibaculum sp. MAR_2009_124]